MRRLATDDPAERFWRQAGVLAELAVQGAAGETAEVFELLDADSPAMTQGLLNHHARQVRGLARQPRGQVVIE